MQYIRLTDQYTNNNSFYFVVMSVTRYCFSYIEVHFGRYEFALFFSLVTLRGAAFSLKEKCELRGNQIKKNLTTGRFGKQ